MWIHPPRTILACLVVPALASCLPFPHPCPHKLIPVYGTETSDLTMSVLSDGFEGEWRAIPEYVDLSVYPDSGSEFSFRLRHSTCTSAKILVTIETDIDNDITSVDVDYYAPQIPPCLVMQEVVARQIEQSCNIEVTTDMDTRPFTSTLTFVSCSLDLVDECPMDSNGDCLEGPSIEQIALSGSFSSEMDWYPCK